MESRISPLITPFFSGLSANKIRFNKISAKAKNTFLINHELAYTGSVVKLEVQIYEEFSFYIKSNTITYY